MIVKKESCCNGNVETFTLTFLSKDSIILWVLKTYRLMKKRYSKELENPSFPKAKIVQIKSDKMLHKFLNEYRP